MAKNDDDTIILTSTGIVFSSTNRMEFKDSSGLPLFNLRRPRLSLLQRWWLELPGGDKILSVKQRWSWAGTKFDITLKNAASEAHEDLTLEV